jgi:hypothetical protein
LLRSAEVKPLSERFVQLMLNSFSFLVGPTLGPVSNNLGFSLILLKDYLTTAKAFAKGVFIDQEQERRLGDRKPSDIFQLEGRSVSRGKERKGGTASLEKPVLVLMLYTSQSTIIRPLKMRNSPSHPALYESGTPSES